MAIPEGPFSARVRRTWASSRSKARSQLIGVKGWSVRGR